MPQADIPELYYNMSLTIQLQKYFRKYGIDVNSQTIPFNVHDAEHNHYAHSKPDLVMWPKDDTPMPLMIPIAINAVEEFKDEVEESNEEESNEVEIGCGELKKTRGGKFQLYGEAFNIIANYAAYLVLKGKQVNKLSVYCLLITNECKKGTLAKLTVDFSKQTCSIIEDGTVYDIDEAIQILAKLLKC